MEDGCITTPAVHCLSLAAEVPCSMSYRSGAMGWRRVEQEAEVWNKWPFWEQTMSKEVHHEQSSAGPDTFIKGNPGINLHILVKSVSFVSCLLFPYKPSVITATFSNQIIDQAQIANTCKPVNSNHITPKTPQSVTRAHYFWYYMTEMLY